VPFVRAAERVESRGSDGLPYNRDQHSNAKAMLERIAAMLVKLAKAQEDA
jgi:hypothetical protein